MYSKLKEIGHGGEGTVYQYNGKALKVMNDNGKEEISKALSKIKLQQIITPDELIYDKRNFVGYTMQYLDHALEAKYITKKDLLESLRVLRKDFEILARNDINGSDLIPNNSLYQDNKLYLIDTSCYEFARCGFDTCLKINNQQLEYYLYRLLQQSTGSLVGSKKIKHMVYDPYTVIEDKMGEYETVEEFAKRLIK